MISMVLLIVCMYVCMYVVSKDIPAGQCNLRIWDIHGQIVSEFIQKKQENW